MTYHATVVYVFRNEQNQVGIGSMNMSLQFRPNTPNGMKRLTNHILHLYPEYKNNFGIINLIPLEPDPIKTDIFDDGE